MTSLPSSYDSPLHLPFNRAALDGRLLLSTPDQAVGMADAHWVLLRGTEVLMTAPSEGEPVWPRTGAPGFAELPRAHDVFLGIWHGQPVYAARLPKQFEAPAGFSLHNLLATTPSLDGAQLSLVGMAHQILHWEKNSRFCSGCGGELRRLPGEWGKECVACHYSHFPHIHPCVIVLVRRAGEVLLTRKREWPEGRYSLVAGFVEFGECLEEAVAREVLEETGVRVKNVRYVGSQSWPFPSQLMAGFIADYDGGEVRVEEKELEDARWFPLTALPTLPPQRSIARYLLDHFIDLRIQPEKGV